MDGVSGILELRSGLVDVGSRHLDSLPHQV